MASFSINNVKISGISVSVPKQITANADNSIFDAEEVKKFVHSTGVHEFRTAAPHTTTADLAFEAALKLLQEMGVGPDEVDVLIFVSQTPDYLNIPNTAPILQERLGIQKGCIAFDVPLGCSGFVYGLSIVASFLQNKNLRKGLLVFGDTLSKIVNPKDKSAAMLFGDAAGCVLLEHADTATEMVFNLGSDGSGYKAIMINDGGARNPIATSSLQEIAVSQDITRRNCELALEGMDVFSFGITQAPKTVRELYEFAGISNQEVDFAIFHQANLMMNEMIRKKLKFPTEQVPMSLEKFGNTSSASIPVTMVTELQSQLSTAKNRLLLCGFGVGLSWGTCYLETDKVKVLDLIEI